MLAMRYANTCCCYHQVITNQVRVTSSQSAKCSCRHSNKFAHIEAPRKYCAESNASHLLKRINVGRHNREARQCVSHNVQVHTQTALAQIRAHIHTQKTTRAKTRTSLDHLFEMMVGIVGIRTWHQKIYQLCNKHE